MTDLQREDRAPPTWQLDGRGGGRRLESSHPPATGTLWIDLDEADAAHRAWLGSEQGVGAEGCALLLQQSAWPRVRIVGPEQLVLVLRIPSPLPGDALEAHALLRFWIEPGRILTVAPRGLPQLRDLRDRLERGRGPRSVGALLLDPIEHLADWLADAVLKLRPELLELELCDDRSRSLAEPVRQLRRYAVELQRYADPNRDLLLRLRSLDVSWLTHDRTHDWHSVSDYFRQASRELDRLVERTRTLSDTVDHQNAEEMNRRIYILTVVSTVVLPLSLFASLLGANVSTVDGNLVGMRDPLWIVGAFAAMPLAGWAIYVFVRRWRPVPD